MATKPIRVGMVNLTGTPEFYATNNYRLINGGHGMSMNGTPDDVTADILPHLIRAQRDAEKALIERMIRQIKDVEPDIVFYDGEFGEFERSQDALEWLRSWLPKDAEQGANDAS